MKRTREKILRRILAFPGSTINDLAQAVGINGISIRHHLTAMEAEGLVQSNEERHGVGRPRLTYSLTNKGVEQFPYKLPAINQSSTQFIEESDDFRRIKAAIWGDRCFNCGILS